MPGGCLFHSLKSTPKEKNFKLLIWRQSATNSILGLDRPNLLPSVEQTSLRQHFALPPCQFILMLNCSNPISVLL